MEEGTQKALMVGIPLAIAGITAAVYFATREGQPPPACNDGDEMLEQCPDGSFIVTHICQNGQWVPTGLACNGGPPPACVTGEQRTEVCPDGSTNVLADCINGTWAYTGNECTIDYRGYTLFVDPTTAMIGISPDIAAGQLFPSWDQAKTFVDNFIDGGGNGGNGFVPIHYRGYIIDFSPANGKYWIMPDPGGYQAHWFLTPEDARIYIDSYIDAPRCTTGEVLTVTCADGSQGITHNCVAGEWVATGFKCVFDLINFGTPDYIELKLVGQDRFVVDFYHQLDQMLFHGESEISIVQPLMQSFHNQGIINSNQLSNALQQAQLFGWI